MDAVTIPVIASSGAGAPEHFSQVFKVTDVQAVRILVALSLFLSLSCVPPHLAGRPDRSRPLTSVSAEYTPPLLSVKALVAWCCKTAVYRARGSSCEYL